MSIFFGADEIEANEIFFGATSIAEVYVGNTLIWPPVAPGLGTVRVTEWGTDNRVTEWSDQRVTEHHT